MLENPSYPIRIAIGFSEGFTDGPNTLLQVRNTDPEFGQGGLQIRTGKRTPKALEVALRIGYSSPVLYRWTLCLPFSLQRTK